MASSANARKLIAPSPWRSDKYLLPEEVDGQPPKEVREPARAVARGKRICRLHCVGHGWAYRWDHQLAVVEMVPAPLYYEQAGGRPSTRPAWSTVRRARRAPGGSARRGARRSGRRGRRSFT